MDQATAEKVLSRCAEEAKVVASEQEAKKASDASAKAAVATATPAAVREPGQRDSEDAGVSMPGALEAAGGAPETTVHGIKTGVGSDELSLEEQAINGLENGAGRAAASEDDETAALAEGRVKPPKA